MLLQYLSFRPHIGDYFFIAKANTALDNISDDGKFPSPYWGLFFYHEALVKENTMLKNQVVSVPVLGIIFLS